MDQAVSFDYFYGGQSDMFSYYRIPRLLITSPHFKTLSTDAKLLYGLLLDRMGLSSRNGWYDGSGRVYIYYALEEIQRDLNCGHDKAVKLLAELDAGKGVGLIERIRQGQGRPAKIYVKQFTTAEIPPQPVSPSPSAEPEPRLPESRSQDFGITETKTSENQKSRLPENRSADFGKSEGNYGQLSAALEELSPVPIHYRFPFPSAAKGCYSHMEQCVYVRPHMSQVQTFKTMVHEVSHAKRHALPVENGVITGVPEKDRRTREVEAESIAYVVCQHFGVDTSDYSFGYIAGWSKGRELEELKSSLSCICETAAELIDGIESRCPDLFPKPFREESVKINPVYQR